MYKIGFIGCGNMAKAMIGGIIGSGFIKANEIICADVNENMLKAAKENLGVEITFDNKQVAKNSELLFLSVKPQFYAQVIDEIAQSVNESTVVITIAPGQSLDKVKEQFKKDIKLVRTMPNTPALVLEGITAICPNELVTDKELSYVCDIFNCFGKTEILEERLMNAVVAVSSSSPAYVFMFIEAMADAAVADGIPRDKAYKLAAQSVYGSAKMVLETNKHPAQLKDMVCSPAGTTIEAVKELEKNGFRNAVMEAMRACTKKAKGL